MQVIVKADDRVQGRYSLYVEGAPNGSWYTGLTFRTSYVALRAARFLNDKLEEENDENIA